MAATLSLQAVLRLHCDRDGLVWYGAEQYLGENTYLEPYDFVNSDLCAELLADVAKIRVLGTRDNASLIVEIRRHMANSGAAALPCWVGSPSLCSGLRETEEVLRQVWQGGLPTTGRWRLLTSQDIVSYMIASELDNQAGGSPEILRSLLEAHPAWPALSFVPVVDTMAASHLVAAILDPRWYRHPEHPGRFSRLFARLGLTPGNAWAWLGNGNGGRNYGNAAATYASWHGGIFHRLYARHDCKMRGLLTASQRFVRFLALVWLGELTSEHSEVYFSPDAFFVDPLERSEFKAHYAECVALREAEE